MLCRRASGLFPMRWAASRVSLDFRQFVEGFFAQGRAARSLLEILQQIAGKMGLLWELRPAHDCRKRFLGSPLSRLKLLESVCLKLNRSGCHGPKLPAAPPLFK